MYGRLLFISILLSLSGKSICQNNQQVKVWLYRPIEFDTIAYTIVFDSMASNGLDQLDSIDTIAKNGYDLGGWEREIMDSLALTNCKILSTEAKPFDSLRKTFYLVAKSDTLLRSLPPPYDWTHNFIISVDSSSLSNLKIGDYDLIRSRIVSQSAYVNGIDNYEFDIFGRSPINNWEPSYYGDIVFFTYPFGVISCDSFVAFKLEFQFWQITGLHSADHKNYIEVKNHSENVSLTNTSDHEISMKHFSITGAQLSEFRLLPGEVRVIRKAALNGSISVFSGFIDNGDYFSFKQYMK